jgi:peroxiredoxin
MRLASVYCLAAALLWYAIAPLCPAQQNNAAEVTAPLGRKVADFVLPDHRGRQHALSNHTEPVVVLAFLGTECPLARLYAVRLGELAREFEGRGMAVLGIDSNRQDSLSDLAAFVQAHELPFPMLKDAGNKLADAVGAQRTPEVFVLDQDRVVRYWGRIDDQYGVGYARPKPERHDLREAVSELLEGKAVSQPHQASQGCRIGRQRASQSAAAVTYSNQIARILQRRCVECHREGEIAPFALTEYEEVAGWAETIAEVVREGRMPPWHANPAYGRFANERALTKAEREAIEAWVAAGAPQGDPAELPPPLESVQGWQLDRSPDLVFEMPREYEVPAAGAVEYQYFRVPSELTRDVWVRAAEVRPGNRAVVHHVLVFAIAPGGRRRAVREGIEGFLAAYVPGRRPRPYPAGMAKRLPAGSELVFQVHYTPNGTPQRDRCRVGLLLADEASITHEVRTTSVVQRFFQIPAGAENHEVRATRWRPLPESLLLSFMPHMHLRGKSFRYVARWPDGTSEILLDVPRYDFNWQTTYYLAEARPIPAGTLMHAVAHYDNSPANLNNPDPQAVVRWGDQTWEEMMLGYFDIAVPRRASPDEDDEAGPAARLEQTLEQLDADGNGRLQRSEVPARLHRLFDRLDANADGVLDEQELAAALPLLIRRSAE